MAIGDKAAAKGLVVYESTQDRRLGYENDNQRGDELADLMDRILVQLGDPGSVPEGTIWVSWAA